MYEVGFLNVGVHYHILSSAIYWLICLHNIDCSSPWEVLFYLLNRIARRVNILYLLCYVFLFTIYCIFIHKDA